jgi:glutamyl-tRNA synthetase
MYIREMDPADLKERLIPFLSRDLDIPADDLRADERLTQLIPLIQERLKLLPDAAEWVDWAFKSADEIDYSDIKPLIGRKLDAAQSADVLEIGSELIAGADPFTAEELETLFRAKAEELGLKLGSFFAPFRGALTGKKVSPPLFESMEILGRDEVLTRVRNGIAVLRAQ